MIAYDNSRFTLEQYQSFLNDLEQFRDDYSENTFFCRFYSAVNQKQISGIEFLLLLKDFFLSIHKQVGLRYTTFNFVRELNESELNIASLIGIGQREVGYQLFLLESAVIEADEEIYQFKNTRYTVPKDMDICLQQKLKAHGYKNYKTEGQQLAVRACLTAKKGSTLFINLPTGCGKSLIIQSSVLFQRKFSSTIVLMPTVGLAIEQAQRMSEILQGSQQENLSWHANLNENERTKIRSDLLSGNQQVLFTSPEALTTSLLNTLFILAKRGQLSEIVIDEAHLIESWGANFRPEFQKFGALVSTLRKITETPFNLIFLSATFTQNSIEKINKIYGDPNILPTIVNGNFLRPEIKTSFEKVSYKNHFTRLLHKAFKLPKPLIIYTTKKDDSNKIFNAFKQLGLNRVGLFTGETSYNHRIEVIDKWQRDQYDIMVATSAFGVGMDKDDVKSVLHASVPENIDRYYQEIGRAGRDGSAATAHLIFHEAQLSTAQGINSDKIISIEKGLSRWKEMWRNSREPQDSYFKEQGFYELNVGLFGNNLRKKTETNADWNWATLLFLQRNSLIRIYYDIPNTTTINENGTIIQTDSEFWKRYQEKVIVELIDSNVLHGDFWETDLYAAREEELKSQRMRFDELKRLFLSPEIPLCDRLTSYYSLFNSRPEKACRGCFGCEGFLPTLGTAPTIQNFQPENSVNQELDSLLSIDNVIPIYFEKSELPKDEGAFSQLVKSLLVKKLVSRVVGDDTCLTEIQENLPPGFSHFWISDSNPNDNSFWPSIFLYREQSTLETPFLQEHLTLIVANKDAKGSTSNYRSWFQVYERSLSLNNFKLLVGI